ncbi:Uncharacterized protein OS=Rhodopirellula europaea SH398 GN=RESH_04568 PE=4 SV=1 [Gemmata massiliana]|uniref:Uncharacterized protein n=1 Tax=Gemmata massiliana TaxID=1210884 RepID=A0A6P2CYR4_9BACT|nr:hypothetical protein [Gemmata massiliana]VTR93265.1 Uncharacterized protein OS=Rhodopirellula europaea SH398 GN=RESH_04568 PE=4 SV=1 [Gemmata massiliana]
MRRWGRWALATGFVLACAGCWYEYQWRHREFCRAVDSELKTLANKCPPDVTRQQWRNVVGWTLNDFRGWLAKSTHIRQEDRGRFLTELRDRLSGPVDLGTVDWLYDELERLTSRFGPPFFWRPTTPERLRQFEGGERMHVSEIGWGE